MSFGLGLSLPIRQILGGGGFSPASLFAAGEIGVWYDPSDFTTLYADTAGTTAITAVEQPVGLMLDKSQGLTVGVELVAAGWTTDAGWAQNDQTFTATAVAQNAEVEKSGLVSAGRAYQVQITWSGLSLGSSWRFYLFQFTTALDISRLSDGESGSRTYRLIAPSSGSVTALRSLAASASSGTFTLSIKELPGNHAVAANGSTARPVLRNRYNLVTYSEQLDQGIWTKQSGTSVTANQAIAPDGTLTADLVTSNGTSGIFQAGIVQIPDTTNVKSVYLKGVSGGESVLLKDPSLTTGTVVCNLTTEWQRFTLTEATSGVSTGIWIDDIPSGGIYIWGAQLTTAADDAAINGEYQRIEAAPTVGSAPTYDDDVTKFPPYLYATTDDLMSTNSIDFSVGDEMSVFAGVTKESDAAAALLFDIGYNTNAQFTVFTAVSGSNYYLRNAGTTQVNVTASTFTAPCTNVLSFLGDISAPLTKIRVDGTDSATSASSLGTGNYRNVALNILGGSGLYFTGRLYSLIVRNKLTTGTDLTNTESYVAQKTGVTL